MKKVNMMLYKYYKQMTTKELIRTAQNYNKRIVKVYDIAKRLVDNKRTPNRLGRMISIDKYLEAMEEEKIYIELELDKRVKEM